MLASRLFPPTLRTAPREAAREGHALLLRAGLVRATASGVYALLPLGVRALDKLARVVERAMDRVQGQRVMLPVLGAEALWSRSGRWHGVGTELFRLKDRRETGFCLSPTHEEAVTELAASVVTSYRQLPLRLYQIGRKFRDEARPRHGLLRAREFVMKDMYSFDVDMAAARATYGEVCAAYDQIFRELRLPCVRAEADVGNIGGVASHEYHVPCDAGEDTLLMCEGCPSRRQYVANVEVARGIPAPLCNASPAEQGGELAPELDSGDRAPDVRWAAFATDRAEAAAAAVDQPVVWVALRRDLAASLTKVARAIAPWRLTNPRPLSRGDDPRARGADAGVVVDAYVSHLVGGLRSPLPRLVADVHEAREGDVCGACAVLEAGDAPSVAVDQRNAGRLRCIRGIEVGHAFLLSQRYSGPFGLAVADASGQKRVVEMGCFGLGVSRVLAAIAEVSRDARGLVWPHAVAPYRAVIVPAGSHGSGGDADLLRAACDLRDGIVRRAPALAGDIVVDDTASVASLGARLSDAELRGFPWIVIVGSRGEDDVELRQRATGERARMTAGELAQWMGERADPAVADASERTAYVGLCAAASPSSRSYTTR